MKTIKQMLRQPLKTGFGVMLLTLAVAILCVSVGQALALQATTEKLNQQFSTVAIPVGTKISNINSTSFSAEVGSELMTWLEETAQENPNIVQGISRHGILSAYIPEMTPLNITTEKYLTTITEGNWGFRFYQAEPHNMPYSCAMLVITLEEVSEPEELTKSYPVEEDLNLDDFRTIAEYKEWLDNAEKETVTQGYTVKLTGTVTDVLSLQEGYRDPTGRIARLTLTVSTLEQIEQLNLIPGEQYVVYGMDYVDEYWKLIGELNYDGRYDWREFEPFDPSELKVMEEWEREKYQHYYEIYPMAGFKDAYAWFYSIMINQREYEMVNAISMTLGVPISLYEYEAIRENGDGKILQMNCITDVTYTDGSGVTVTVGAEEYTRRYRIPTIAHLDGSFEELLATAEGSAWQKALERDAINNQAFAVIGVDKLGYLADFALERSAIVAGRDFAAEELKTGARVCIIHEELALANGLEVGDTITASFYGTDFGLPYQQFRTENKGSLNPTASFYFDTTPFTETAEYTIVGICRGERTFPDVAENEYAFSANTVYVPRSSVQTPMETCDSVLFVTVALQNGKIEQFHTLVKQAGYAGQFKYCDQGYSVIASNFHNYETLARQVLVAGATVYCILLLLFLLMYPGSQKRNTKTMASLGVTGGRRFGHVFLSGAAVALVASLAGCLVGTLLWDRVVDALQTSAESTVALQIEPGTLTLIAVVQLVLALLLNACVAAFLTAPKGMSGRR